MSMLRPLQSSAVKTSDEVYPSASVLSGTRPCRLPTISQDSELLRNDIQQWGLLNFPSLRQSNSRALLEYLPLRQTFTPRLSEEPSFATTVQGVYLYLYFAATCFGLRWPSSGGIYNILGSYLSYNGSGKSLPETYTRKTYT
jgi:hypothetical protein